ncbi:Tn7 transposase TnsA N-terminal domain-containing protein [Paraburkholderia sp. DD10]|uniref:Tn7 transposase TnsA N-terminal domain-containing protein n=1 Tax=Paraburkholderia sp. DD10 TaxID=3409691 RepID=UPI003B9F232E
MAQFESLVELKALQALEVAPSVKSITTQPRVFEYTEGARRRRYTPDVEIEVEIGAAIEAVFLEVKDDETFTPDSEAAERIQAALSHLRQQGERLHIVLRSDLIANELDQKLALILGQRPRRIRFRTDIDPTIWDPEMGTVPSADIQQRWEDAKRECDELLRRITNRDPDDLLPVSTR